MRAASRTSDNVPAHVRWEMASFCASSIWAQVQGYPDAPAENWMASRSTLSIAPARRALIPASLMSRSEPADLEQHERVIPEAVRFVRGDCPAGRELRAFAEPQAADVAKPECIQLPLESPIGEGRHEHGHIGVDVAQCRRVEVVRMLMRDDEGIRSQGGARDQRRRVRGPCAEHRRSIEPRVCHDREATPRDLETGVAVQGQRQTRGTQPTALTECGRRRLGQFHKEDVVLHHHVMGLERSTGAVRQRPSNANCQLWMGHANRSPSWNTTPL